MGCYTNIELLCRRVENERRNWVAWDQVCRFKDEGSRGLKDVNIVMLSNNVWKILIDKHYLWAKWISYVKLKRISF